MINIDMPDFSIDGQTWGTVAATGVGGSGTLILAERYADGDDFRLTYAVLLLDTDGRIDRENVVKYDDLTSRTNKVVARMHYRAALDLFWA